MSLESVYDSLHSSRLRLERVCDMLERELEECKRRQAEIERLKRSNVTFSSKIELDSTPPIRKVVGVNA